MVLPSRQLLQHRQVPPVVPRTPTPCHSPRLPGTLSRLTWLPGTAAGSSGRVCGIAPMPWPQPQGHRGLGRPPHDSADSSGAAQSASCVTSLARGAIELMATACPPSRPRAPAGDPLSPPPHAPRPRDPGCASKGHRLLDNKGIPASCRRPLCPRSRRWRSKGSRPRPLSLLRAPRGAGSKLNLLK